MPIYTRTGDDGDTTLPGGVRTPKDAPLLEVCGTLDELGAALGLARCEPLSDGILALLEQIQHQLFRLGGELLAGHPDQIAAISSDDVTALEQLIDRYQARLNPTASFVLAGGCRAAAVLHLARTICRRAERRLVSLARSQTQSVTPCLLAYLNRLSDLLFVLARTANLDAGEEETPC